MAKRIKEKNESKAKEKRETSERNETYRKGKAPKKKAC